MRIFVVLVFSMLISACIALPATKENENSNCDLVSHEMYVDTVVLGMPDFSKSEGNGEAELLVIGTGLAIYSVSWVISGSIVLIGNTILWLETKGKCDEREFETIQITKDNDFVCNIDSGQCQVQK